MTGGKVEAPRRDTVGRCCSSRIINRNIGGGGSIVAGTTSPDRWSSSFLPSPKPDGRCPGGDGHSLYSALDHGPVAISRADLTSRMISEARTSAHVRCLRTRNYRRKPSLTDHRRTARSGLISRQVRTSRPDWTSENINLQFCALLIPIGVPTRGRGLGLCPPSKPRPVGKVSSQFCPQFSFCAQRAWELARGRGGRGCLFRHPSTGHRGWRRDQSLILESPRARAQRGAI